MFGDGRGTSKATSFRIANEESILASSGVKDGRMIFTQQGLMRNTAAGAIVAGSGSGRAGRLQYTVRACHAVYGLSLRWFNWGRLLPDAAGWQERGPGNAVTVSAAVRVGGVGGSGTWHTFTWSGASSISVADGEEMPAPDTFAPFYVGAGDLVTYDIRVEVSGSNGYFPTPNFINDTNFVRFQESTTIASVGAVGSNIASNVGSIANVPMMPIPVAHFGNPNIGVVVAWGDSIASGQADLPQEANPTFADGQYVGWVTRGVNSISTETPTINISVGGDRAQFNLWDSLPKTMAFLGSLNIRAAIVALGTNDVNASRTWTSFESDINTIGNQLQGLGVQNRYICTLVPRVQDATTFTATRGAQTPVQNSGTTGWQTYNTNIRAKAYGPTQPFTGFVDVNSVVDDGTGTWGAGTPVAGVVRSGTSTSQFTLEEAYDSDGSNKYGQWVVRFLTGDNAGQYRPILSVTNNGGFSRITLQTSAPSSVLPNIPVAGDTVELIPVWVTTENPTNIHPSVQGMIQMSTAISPLRNVLAPI